MSITRHPDFLKIKPYIKLSFYKRDANEERGPRWRIGFYEMPKEILKIALKLEMPCVSCGEKIYPIRGSVKGLYYSCTCMLKKSLACCRKKEAEVEYYTVREHVGDYTPNPNQLELPYLELE